MECNPEESIVSEKKLQAEASALQHTQVREEASQLDAQWRFWTELSKTGSDEEKISPGDLSPVLSVRTSGWHGRSHDCQHTVACQSGLNKLALEMEQMFSVGGVYVCSSTRVQQQPKLQRG